MIFSIRSILYPLIIGSLSLANLAKGSDADLCDQSIEQVAASSIVPRDIIYKVARLESGRNVGGRYVSWPWSLNNGGEGHFFNDSSTALSELSKFRAQGRTNIDVGCMQLNIRWHAEFFDSEEQMMNPLDNVRYAARYLEQLYKETGSWETAVKFYHSRNAKFNTVYFAKYKKIKPPNTSQMLASSPPSQTMPLVQNANSSQIFPLFWTESAGALIKMGEGNASSLSFADVRNFSVEPLIKM